MLRENVVSKFNKNFINQNFWIQFQYFYSNKFTSLEDSQDLNTKENIEICEINFPPC